MSTGQRVAGIWVSDLTAGFVSWLEDVSALWEARQRGERVALPRWMVLWLLFVAAVGAALCMGCDMASQAMTRRRLLRQISRDLGPPRGVGPA